MLIRYDFADKLDLSRFKRQAPFYIGKMRELTYNIFAGDFKLNIEITTPDDTNAHSVQIDVIELFKNEDIEITEHARVNLATDSRFKELQVIKYFIDRLWINDSIEFTCNCAEFTTSKICDLIVIIHKINSLKAFL